MERESCRVVPRLASSRHTTYLPCVVSPANGSSRELHLALRRTKAHLLNDLREIDVWIHTARFLFHALIHDRYVAARVLRSTMAQVALIRTDDRTSALRDTMAELLGMDEPRRRLAAEMSGLGVHYDLGEGHPLLGRRMPDLELVTASGPLRLFTLLHDARPVLLNLNDSRGFDITPWADKVKSIDARYSGAWELPALGVVLRERYERGRRRAGPPSG